MHVTHVAASLRLRGATALCQEVARLLNDLLKVFMSHRENGRMIMPTIRTFHAILSKFPVPTECTLQARTYRLAPVRCIAIRSGQLAAPLPHPTVCMWVWCRTRS